VGAPPVRRILLWTAAGLLGLGVTLQFFPAETTNPAVVSNIDAPPEIDAILRRSCYDCHSHESRWPWYSRVAPVSWWVVDHVRHARADLNFSRWPTFDPQAQQDALDAIAEKVADDEMPLPSYLILHRDARLSEADRETLVRWAREGF
jgi:hypothetical protein